MKCGFPFDCWEEYRDSGWSESGSGGDGQQKKKKRWWWFDVASPPGQRSAKLSGYSSWRLVPKVKQSGELARRTPESVGGDGVSGVRKGVVPGVSPSLQVYHCAT